MTAKGRRAMLRRELDRARDDVSPTIYKFAVLCERLPAPPPGKIAKVAGDLYLKIGRVAGLATNLAREVRHRAC